jgi:hypothetical protein
MYTLVRHNMWTVNAFPRFRNGLEPVRISPLTALLVEAAGGVLLPDEPSAWDAAEGFMYPDGTSVMPPRPDGIFLHFPILHLPLFVPGFSEDLIAA